MAHLSSVIYYTNKCHSSRTYLCTLQLHHRERCVFSCAGREFILKAAGVCLLGRSSGRVQFTIRATGRQSVSAIQLYRVWYVYHEMHNKISVLTTSYQQVVHLDIATWLKGPVSVRYGVCYIAM